MEAIQHINGTKVKFLGDPHIGKKFVHGVLLERRGEREGMQYHDLLQAVTDPEGAKFHICVGDIFDKMVVSPEEVIKVAAAYKYAAWSNPKTNFVIIRGNHDASRDMTKRSSFDVLKEILESYSNIYIFSEANTLGNIAFCPWSPFKTATEVLESLPSPGPYDAVIGHWDMDDFGDENPNLIPVPALKKVTNLAYTGHVHVSYTATYGDLTVHVTGSMQPYTHAEDPEGNLYVTLTPDEAAERDDLTNKCVRIKAGPDEDVPEINCLQLTVKRTRGEAEEPEDLSIDEQKFDFDALFRQVMSEHGVPDDLVQEVRGMYEEDRESDQ